MKRHFAICGREIEWFMEVSTQMEKRKLITDDVADIQSVSSRYPRTPMSCYCKLLCFHAQTPLSLLNK